MARTKPRIIREGPYLAKSGPGYVYPSHSTIEREWSDGTIDYACSKCGRESDTVRQTCSHYAKAHAKPGSTTAWDRQRALAFKPDSGKPRARRHPKEPEPPPPPPTTKIAKRSTRGRPKGLGLQAQIDALTQRVERLERKR